MKRFIAGVLFFIIGVLPIRVAAVEISDIRLAAHTPTTVRFVADLSDETEVLISRLSNPQRLVIDFQNTTFSKEAREKVFQKTSFVEGLRTGYPEKNKARVVLDLPTFSLEEKHFLLKPQSNAGWRFVLDLEKPASVAIPEMKASVPKAATPPPKKQRIIMLDPGHGGQDPGAISRSGRYEKNITLQMAKELKTLLQKAGYKVVMTRETDIFIPLRGRIKKAHDARADLFISIHADSAKNKSAKGLSVYTISEKASDKEAAALAERENKADLILSLDLSDVDPELSSIFLDLEKQETMNRSADYAKCVVEEMKKKVDLVPNAHRQAGFVVLKSPSVPSVLVELGYLSNKTEDKNLQKASYRKKLAESLVRAVDTYFQHVKD